jgi:hypothetical protein
MKIMNIAKILKIPSILDFVTDAPIAVPILSAVEGEIDQLAANIPRCCIYASSEVMWRSFVVDVVVRCGEIPVSRGNQ